MSSNFLELPIETQEHILSFADTESVLNIRAVSRGLRTVTHSRCATLDLRHLRSRKLGSQKPNLLKENLDSLLRSFENLRVLHCGEISVAAFLVLATHKQLIELEGNFSRCWVPATHYSNYETYCKLPCNVPWQLTSLTAHKWRIDQWSDELKSLLSPSLTALHLKRDVVNRLTDAAERTIAEHIITDCTQLTSLTLYGAASTNDAFLPLLLDSLPLLRDLSLTYVVKTDFSHLQSPSLCLERFCVRAPFGGSVSGQSFQHFEQFLERCPNLRALVLNADGLGNRTEIGTSLGNIGHTCPLLEELDISTEIDDKGLQSLSVSAPRLRRLHVSADMVFHDFTVLARGCPLLEFLDLPWDIQKGEKQAKVSKIEAKGDELAKKCEAECPIVTVLKHLPHIHSLSLELGECSCQSSHDELFADRLSQMRVWKISDSNSLSLIQRGLLPSLETWSGWIDPEESPIGLEQIASACPLLKSLTIMLTPASSCVIRTPMLCLRELAIDFEREGDGSTSNCDLFSLLRMCPKLKSIAIRGLNLSPNEVLTIVRMFPSLSVLRLSAPAPMDPSGTTEMLIELLSIRCLRILDLECGLSPSPTHELMRAIDNAQHLCEATLLLRGDMLAAEATDLQMSIMSFAEHPYAPSVLVYRSKRHGEEDGVDE